MIISNGQLKMHEMLQLKRTKRKKLQCPGNEPLKAVTTHTVGPGNGMIEGSDEHIPVMHGQGTYDINKESSSIPSHAAHAGSEGHSAWLPHQEIRGH